MMHDDLFALQQKVAKKPLLESKLYELPEDLFVSIWEKGRHSRALGGNKHVVEKIYIPKFNK